MRRKINPSRSVGDELAAAGHGKSPPWSFMPSQSPPPQVPMVVLPGMRESHTEGLELGREANAGHGAATRAVPSGF